MIQDWKKMHSFMFSLYGMYSTAAPTTKIHNNNFINMLSELSPPGADNSMHVCNLTHVLCVSTSSKPTKI